MANIRFTKEISFDVVSDLRIINALNANKLAILQNVAIDQDTPIRIYIFDPDGKPFIIFDGVPYVIFVGMWGPNLKGEPKWDSFPCLNLAAFAGPACIETGDVSVKSIVFLCLELSEYSVINPCDPDGSFHDAVKRVIERHRQGRNEIDQNKNDV